MKQLFFLIFFTILTSCNSVKYYEYYHNDNIPEFNSIYDYCTLEVRKDKAIYRAYTNQYHEKKYPAYYLYIETEKVDGEDYISLARAKKFYYFTNYDTKNKIDYPLLSDKDIMQIGGYTKEKNYYTREKKQPEDYHFENYDLEHTAVWFPSELKRVKKIDYSKFPKKLQEKINLENPDAKKDSLK